MVLYGSLMSFFNTQDELGIRDKLKLLGRCELPGRLYNIGAYPGFKSLHENHGSVQAELYQLVDPQVLIKLDEFEDYIPDDVNASLYLRTLVSLKQFDIKAWVYIYNRPVLESAYIRSGNWQQHLKDSSKNNC